MKLSSEEREAFLALKPAEREAIGDHAMTIDELKKPEMTVLLRALIEALGRRGRAGERRMRGTGPPGAGPRTM